MSASDEATLGVANLFLFRTRGTTGIGKQAPRNHPYLIMKELNFDTRTLYRNGILALLLICVALIVHNVFSQNGYMASRRQRKDLQALQQKIQQIKAENEQLDRENHALKSNPAAVERLAREQYGLAKPGEKIYSLPTKTAPATLAPTTK